MTIRIDITSVSTCAYPSQTDIKKWVKAALNNHRNRATISLRIVDAAEMHSLNLQYRQKDKPTNVLSFPCTLPELIRGDLLGDLVICAPIVEKEAQHQGKSLQSHWAHLVIHGTLHLLGYDHEAEQQAQQMESLEVNIMQTLGFNDPYQIEKLHD